MRTTRLIKAIICTLLLISFSLSFLLACANQEETQSPDNFSDDVNQAADIPEEIESTEKLYQFPDDADYNGYEMRILNLDEDMVHWAITSIDVAEETGDVIMDAAYRRNRIVEEGLKITIKEVYSTDPPSLVRRTVNAGTDDYDVVFTYSNAAGTLASQGMYLDLFEIKAFNFEELWWDHGAIDAFELMNSLYFTTSDSHIMTNDSIWVLFFNKQMIQNYGLDNPYQLVRENKFTMDAMLEMMRQTTIDLDGDGAFTVNDQWGISSHSFATMAFLLCTDSPLITKDGDGIPYLVEPNERFINAYEKTREFLNKENGMFLDAQGTYPGKSAEFDHPTKTFLANKSLFCGECLSHTRVFREMENDFGILPHPKLDSNQERYLTLMVDTTPCFGIPITNPDPERTGTFMEALTGISATTVIPAYYDVSMTNKFMRDEDSVEMLDLIRANRLYELAIVYNWASFYGSLTSHGFSPNGANPMTIYDRNSDRVTVAIERTIEAFEEVR